MLSEEIKNAFGNATDLIVRPFIIDNREITLVMSEVMASSSYVNDFILKKFTRWQKTKRKEKQASNK